MKQCSQLGKGNWQDLPQDRQVKIRTQEIHKYDRTKTCGKVPWSTTIFSNLAERQDEVGVATAVAWTESGGEIANACRSCKSWKEKGIFR